jgi:drug/metabolite transporter (DMT)-like permease
MVPYLGVHDAASVFRIGCIRVNSGKTPRRAEEGYTPRVRLALLTAAALTGFSANSLLTRAAITGGYLDPWTFMGVRMATGALTLWLVLRFRAAYQTGPGRERGSWAMGAWLGGYAILFTVAYTRIDAGPGALLLFGSVQLTMFFTALVRGERLSSWQWLGVGLALSGLLVLTLPGLTAPDPIGAALMAGAGACWGAYSLAGKRARDPLAVTGANFVRAATGISLIVLAVRPEGPVSSIGIGLAALSGAIASGMAYAAWYAVLPSLPAWRAATIQLAVPVLTAAAAALVLDESLSPRLLIAMVLVVAGIWFATRSR